MTDVFRFYVLPAVAYMIVASPQTYQMVRSVAGSWVATPEGTAKLGGLILHAIVFVLLASLLMSLFPKKSYKHGGAMSDQELYGMSTKPEEVPHLLKPAPY